MSRRVFSGHQPNFFPYMGYFYKMHRSDVFVIDDDVQFSSKEWTNRNFIKVNGQKYKVTVPVSYEFGDPINAVKISYTRNWNTKLLDTIRMNYRKAAHFDEAMEFVASFLDGRYELLSDMNLSAIRQIAERLGIGCHIVVASTDLPTELRNNERNVWQCVQVGCNTYYSGLGGKAYNDEEMYASSGIDLEYTDYSPVVYPQVGRFPFIENLSVIDYLMNCGFVFPAEWQ